MSKRQRQPTVRPPIRGQIVACSPAACHVSAIPSPSSVSTGCAEKENARGAGVFEARGAGDGDAVGDGAGVPVGLGKGGGVTGALD
jgi:hypothetical protein